MQNKNLSTVAAPGFRKGGIGIQLKMPRYRGEIKGYEDIIHQIS